MNHERWSVAAWGLVLLAGCGGPDGTSISGSVSWNGKPVSGGTIILVPLGTGGRKVNAPITDGSYAFPPTAGLQPGPYRVEISWPQKTGKKTESVDPEQVTEQTAETIPGEFNASSKLRIEVQSGENTFPFALPTK